MIDLIKLILHFQFVNIAIIFFHKTAIEEEVRNIQNKKKALETKGVELDEEEAERVGLGATGHYDQDIYSNSGKTSLLGYDTSIAASEERDVSIGESVF